MKSDSYSYGSKQLAADILSVGDLAAILGVSKNTIHYRVKKGYLPDTRVGNKQIFYKHDLVETGVLNGYESTDGEVFYVD